jgi:hypothetical protein
MLVAQVRAEAGQLDRLPAARARNPGPTFGGYVAGTGGLHSTGFTAGPI